MRRSIRTILVTLLAALGSLVPAAMAHAQGMPIAAPASQNDAVSRTIWSGLWSGVNLDAGGGFSGTRPAAPPQAPSSSSSSSGRGLQSSSMYVALGDSVAAGVGLPNPVPVPSNYTRCGRTSEAYPFAVAQNVGMSLLHTACSGATVGDLFTIQRSSNTNLPPQLDTAFASGKPQLITITAGANDAHWVQFITTCYYSNCATNNNTTLANDYLATLAAKLQALFGAIWLKSGGQPPTTIITGYYNPVSATCTSKYSNNVTSDEISWINNEVTSLNKTIQNAASAYSYVRFIPIDFTGHDICSNNSWIQGPNDAQPFHPTVTGQQVMAKAVLNALGR